MADRMAGILSRLGVPLSQARALDLIARICGLPDWDRMRAGLVRLEGAQVPVADHALTRLLRLDAPDPAVTVRAVEAVWHAHLTDHERADPLIREAAEWLRAGTGAAWAWAAAQRTPFTPDLLGAALEAGTGRRYLDARVRPTGILPNLLDLTAWVMDLGQGARGTEPLVDLLHIMPGYDPGLVRSGKPQSGLFARAASPRMRLTMTPIRDLIAEVRMEGAPEPDPIGAMPDL